VPHVVLKAVRAAFTASSTSAFDACEILASSCAVAGFKVGTVSPVDDARNSLLLLSAAS